ncbi:o-succinylbenzoate--CoA ligase [Virgibacillus litoralis]|uniref:Fatty-acyl-CoA synthase n=1 Tax=Virgibacillus litoralis TaxID=578221 RepID=A0ABS4HC82_9BACI|nr:o-succinylbenzoate--CoA ligase [Virgibacillus litoralis]MBP1948254.1 fatty-acyl-CoA synthase [Virgibacillus litoralis]
MSSISYWIHKRAEITPDRVAMIGVKEERTYHELSQDIYKMASILKHKLLLSQGDRVAILSQNREEYMVTYLAIAHLGLIAVPLNIRLSAPELAFQIKDSGAGTIIYESETEILYNDIRDHVNFENAFSFDESDMSKLSYEEISKSSHLSSDPFIICYTSGTTGRPKGAVLTQGNMYWNAVNNQLAIDITSDDKSIILLPLFHIGGIGLFAFPTLLAGGTIIIPEKFEPDSAIQSIEDHQVTIVMGVPAIHDAIRKSKEFKTANFELVRWFYSGGAPCPKELINAYIDHGHPFGQGFGMTETAPTIFMISKEDYKRKAGSIGKPVMFTDISIINEDGESVPNGEIGELLIKGPNVMKEYWGLPDETDKALRDGWLYSGDLVRRDEEGFIYVAGRKKDMIISGGENIYPLEIEQVIKELAQVSETAVIGVQDEKWGEVPIAFLSFNRNHSVIPDEVKDHCSSKLGKYKIPKKIIELDELPKNATGKIDKKALRAIWNRGEILHEF